MKIANPFVVSKFKNPSGETVYRVSGRLNGERVRKNFATRAEADAESQVLAVQRLQAEAGGIRTAITRLTDGQLKEAEAAFARLGESPKHPLLVYLDFALTNYREPNQQMPLADAATAYLATKKAAHEKTLLSGRQLRSIENELTVLQKKFPKALVSQFTPVLLMPHLERGKHSLKTYNNRRGVLSTFFKFCLQKDWVLVNPIEKTPHHRINHRRGSAVTITAEKAAEVMAYVETYEGGKLVPYFAICLFAGIRPCVRFGEITKLQPESVKLETCVIHIEPEVSKVRMKRLVTIQPNLAAWLKAYPLEKFPLVPKNAVNIHRRICAKFKLTHDVLRHTFISMFVAKFRSMGEAALQAGNSEAIIRKHYLDLKSKEEAERFFDILPKRTGVVGRAPDQFSTVAPALAIAV
ncbi:MAG: site-specific integrase [Verrucomicrobiota bacterium]